MSAKDFKQGTENVKNSIKKLLMEQISKATYVHKPKTDKYKVNSIEVVTENDEKFFVSYGYQNFNGINVEVLKNGERRQVYTSDGENKEWLDALDARREEIKSNEGNNHDAQNLALLQEMFGKGND